MFGNGRVAGNASLSGRLCGQLSWLERHFSIASMYDRVMFGDDVYGLLKGKR